jgi:hypothetical protein
VTQPPLDDRMPTPIRPNNLSEGAEGSANPRPNRLSGMLDAGARARLPGVSGRWSAVLLLVLFLAVAVVLPLALHRSAWVEAEIVIGAWFLIWTAVLAWLGFAGRTVDEDWGTFRRPRRLFGRGGNAGGGGTDGGTGVLDAAPFLDLSGVGLPDFDAGGDDGGLGCLGAILAVVVAVAAIAAIVALLYFTIGYVIPLIVIALYTIVRAMLNHVAARGHVTQGDLPASLARGAFWAALYTTPLAIAIWLLHVAL